MDSVDKITSPYRLILMSTNNIKIAKKFKIKFNIYSRFISLFILVAGHLKCQIICLHIKFTFWHENVHLPNFFLVNYRYLLVRHFGKNSKCSWKLQCKRFSSDHFNSRKTRSKNAHLINPFTLRNVRFEFIIFWICDMWVFQCVWLSFVIRLAWVSYLP